MVGLSRGAKKQHSVCFGHELTSRRGSPVVLRVELLDGLLNEGGAVAFDFERDVALLPVAKLLHLTTELDFLDGKEELVNSSKSSRRYRLATQ